MRTGNRHPMRIPKMYYDEGPRGDQASALCPARVLDPAAGGAEVLGDPF